MAGTDDVVGVAPDGAGKSISVRKVNTLLDDGTFESAEIQAVTLVDKDGRSIDLFDLVGVLKNIRDDLAFLRQHLEIHVG